jgi:hypothetical protein
MRRLPHPSASSVVDAHCCSSRKAALDSGRSSLASGRGVPLSDSRRMDVVGTAMIFAKPPCL